MGDATHDAEHLAAIATATAELAELQKQAEAVLERARPALRSFSEVFDELDDQDELDGAKVQPFLDASGLGAFWERVTAFGDSLRRGENVQWLLGGDDE